MKKALLIIDLQKGFNPSKEMVEGFRKKAEEYEIVVATKFINGNKLYNSVLNYPDLTAEELELVELPNQTKVFEKTGYGLPSELISYLKEKDVSFVDIGGLETDACVLAAMYNLWDAEIQPNLLKDLSMTPEQNICEAALLVSKRNFGS